MNPILYVGTTGVLPVDNSIKKLLKTGYLHHIERLMIVSNFMNLLQIHPNHIYKWFMELFVDAYDWVMVPNVYGMATYADGGLMTTKPYISGSNYLKKMSDYVTGQSVFSKQWGFSFTTGYRWRFYKGLYGMGFAGLTDKKGINSFFPRFGFALGWDLLKQQKK